jgi:hypothetical protein
VRRKFFKIKIERFKVGKVIIKFSIQNENSLNAHRPGPTLKHIFLALLRNKLARLSPADTDQAIAQMKGAPFGIHI